MTYRTTISVQELHSALRSQDDILVFACEFDLADTTRGCRLFEAGHIPGARFIDLTTELSAPAGSNGRHPLPARDRFGATMRSHGLRTEQQVVVYDSSANAWAPRLWWLLRWIGHANVAVLDGGLAAWTAAEYRIERGEAGKHGLRGDVTVGASLVGIADVREIEASLQADAPYLLDGRSADRFRGVPNPVDPVSGHIPGAGSRPFTDNMGENGLFKSREQLARDFTELLRDRRASEVVLYCGSGVTACNNALAMEIAGLPGARLYPGSWSEWIADPGRPVERTD